MKYFSKSELLAGLVKYLCFLLIIVFSLICCSDQQNHSNKLLSQVDKIIYKAIADSIFPGANLVIGNNTGIQYAKSFGGYDYSGNTIPIKISTIFDLASLTKVIATTSAVMKLYEDGKIDLDSPVVKYIPRFNSNNKSQITVRNLLIHNSGFPPGKPFYNFCKTKQEALDSLYKMPLKYKTGTKTVYSDLSFITLGHLVEVISGMSLDQYLQENIFLPMGLEDIMFNPPDSLWRRIAPTEVEYNFGLTKKHGRVRNKITQLFGGVAGHAGLFSSAPDLSKIAIMYLNIGQFKNTRIFRESTIKLFTSRHSDISTRGLGWDTGNGNKDHPIGHYFSLSAFGHTGFTGTSIWIDPAKNLFIILLTNRTYRMKDRNKIIEFRPLVHDEILSLLENYNSK
ncbi:serine hydrolase domain-containing protein [Bacteroidota bacterium]